MKPLKLPSLSIKLSFFNIVLGILVIIILIIIGTYIHYFINYKTYQPQGPLQGFPPESSFNGIHISSNSTITPFMDNFSFYIDHNIGIKIGIADEKSDDLIFKSVDNNIADAGILMRNLTNNETASGYNQTLVAYYNNNTIMPIVLITKGKPTGVLQIFIDFALSPKGQSIVAEAGLIPLNNSSINA